MSFTIDLFKKITFVSKNWFNDSRVSFKTPINLIKFIKMDVHLKKRLEEFDGEFEREEIVYMLTYGRETLFPHFPSFLVNNFDYFIFL